LEGAGGRRKEQDERSASVEESDPSMVSLAWLPASRGARLNLLSGIGGGGRDFVGHGPLL